MSLRSGYHVAGALKHLGHSVNEVDVSTDLVRSLQPADVAFIVLHGRDGEDGTVQLACEALGIPYTGSSPLTCRFCFDKGLAKGLLNKAGLPTPPGYVLSAEAVRHMGAGAALRHAAERLGYPLVVKPSAQGSALGLAVVEDAADLSAAAISAFDYGDRILLERFVPGAEISVGLLGGEPSPLPGIEIRTASDVFDFETRVSPGRYDFVRAAESLSEQTQQVALQAARLFGLRDFGRVDMRVGEDGPVVLDAKTCPGLSETSIVPLAVAEAGLTFEDFVAAIVESALARSASVRNA
jgi:D-alanine-D-alanine ligase